MTREFFTNSLLRKKKLKDFDAKYLIFFQKKFCYLTRKKSLTKQKIFRFFSYYNIKIYKRFFEIFFSQKNLRKLFWTFHGKNFFDMISRLQKPDFKRKKFPTEIKLHIQSNHNRPVPLKLKNNLFTQKFVNSHTYNTNSLEIFKKLNLNNLICRTFFI